MRGNMIGVAVVAITGVCDHKIGVIFRYATADTRCHVASWSGGENRCQRLSVAGVFAKTRCPACVIRPHRPADVPERLDRRYAKDLARISQTLYPFSTAWSETQDFYLVADRDQLRNQGSRQESLIIGMGKDHQHTRCTGWPGAQRPDSASRLRSCSHDSVIWRINHLG